MKIFEVYKESTATMKLHKAINNIPIQERVRQGDTISPKLHGGFRGIFKNLEWEEARIQINGEYLDNLRFADDIV